MEGRKILIVDDDAINSKVLAQRLAKRGYDVSTHDIGAGTIEMVELSKFELVLLDIMLPDISGLEVLQQLRAKFKKVELPVIMVTAKDAPEDVRREERDPFLQRQGGAQERVRRPAGAE